MSSGNTAQDDGSGNSARSGPFSRPLSPAHPARAHAAAGSGILVVDDERDIGLIVRMALERYCYKVDAFSDPLEALRHFEKDPARYDLAILDIRMPSMDGFELAARIRRKSSSIRLVLMTAFDIDSQVWRSVIPDAGVDAVLKKPFAVTEICRVVEQELAKARKD